MNKLFFSILIISTFAAFSCNRVSSSNENNTIQNSVNHEDSITENIVEHPYISNEYVLGKVNPVNDSMFVEVPQKYCLIRKEYVHKDVLEPFIAMYEAAAKEGINLGIVSAHRSFVTQKWLWNQRYYNSSNPESVAKNVLSYLAMPGTSRHHWGTDIDVLNTKLYYFETEEGKKSYQWMCDNAADFGFYQVYTKDRSTGYNEEKWHWSYLPVAKEYQFNFRQNITYKDLNGFNGCELAESLNVIDEYVFGINSKLICD